MTQFSMIYCTHCLKKLVSQQEPMISGGRALFFMPVMDGLQRAFYVYLSMTQEDLKLLWGEKEPRSVDLYPYVEILHVEEGWWPEPLRQQEIRDFYSPATHVVRHNIKAAA